MWWTTSLLLRRDDSGRTHGQAEDRQAERNNLAVAESEAAMQQGQQRDNPRPKLAGWEPSRCRAGHVLAVRTLGLMETMFGHVGLDRRDVPDIARLIDAGGISRDEGMRTLRAGGGVMIGDLVNLIGKRVGAMLPGMAGLTTTRTAARRLGRAGWRGRRIGGGRFGRIAGILGKPGTQVGDLLLEGGDLGELSLLLRLKIVDDAHERAHNHLHTGGCVRPIRIRNAQALW